MVPVRNLVLFGFIVAFQVTAFILLFNSIRDHEAWLRILLLPEGFVANGVSLALGAVAMKGSTTVRIVAIAMSLVLAVVVLPLHVFWLLLLEFDHRSGLGANQELMPMTWVYMGSFVATAALLACYRSNATASPCQPDGRQGSSVVERD